MEKSKNIVWHESTITKAHRHRKNGHKSCVLWFTGLSGSGKSTLANAVDHALFQLGVKSYVLDGDNIRHGLNKDLGFGKEDRQENIRRIGEVAKLFVDSGTIICTAFISPYREDRECVRELFQENEFIEIFLDCPLNVCEYRDPKGLYKKARNGEISNFTGITSPYEKPITPEITIPTSEMNIDDSINLVLSYLVENQIIRV